MNKTDLLNLGKDALSWVFKTGKSSGAYKFDLNDLKTTAKRTAVVAVGAGLMAGAAYLSNAFNFGLADALVATKTAALIAAIAAYVKDHTGGTPSVPEVK